MNVALAKTETGHAPSDAFAVVRDRLPGAGKVADARREAFEAYERVGLPHRRIEDWKYTDLRALMREVLPLAAEPDAAALTRAEAALASLAMNDAHKLVLVDGVWAPTLSDVSDLDAGVRVRVLRDVLQDAGNEARADLLESGAISDPMISLNAAMVTDGVLITVADGAAPAKPLHIVHVATRSSAAVYTRSFLTVGKGARATLLESFVAADGAQVLSGQ